MSEDLMEFVCDLFMKVLVGTVIGVALQVHCKSKFGVY